MHELKRLYAFALMAAMLTACGGTSRADAAPERDDDPFIVRGQVSVGGMSGNPAQGPGAR